MMSKCNNLRRAETCEHCRYMVCRWDFEGGEDFLHYCNVDGDEPTDPDMALWDTAEEWRKVWEPWQDWSRDHIRHHAVCDAWEHRMFCFGRRFGEQTECPNCAYQVEC